MNGIYLALCSIVLGAQCLTNSKQTKLRVIVTGHSPTTSHDHIENINSLKELIQAYKDGKLNNVDNKELLSLAKKQNSIELSELVELKNLGLTEAQLLELTQSTKVENLNIQGWENSYSVLPPPVFSQLVKKIKSPDINIVMSVIKWGLDEGTIKAVIDNIKDDTVISCILLYYVDSITNMTPKIKALLENKRADLLAALARRYL
jgi:hypothetical protein